jgi:hypothetical protein
MANQDTSGDGLTLTYGKSKFSRESGKAMSQILALYRKERAGKPPQLEVEEDLDPDAQAIRIARIFSGMAPKRPVVNFEAEDPRVVFKPRALHEILSLALSKEASDARDLVYGILGLVKDEERIRIPVDYGTTTPMDVFK